MRGPLKMGGGNRWVCVGLEGRTRTDSRSAGQEAVIDSGGAQGETKGVRGGLAGGVGLSTHPDWLAGPRIRRS